MKVAVCVGGQLRRDDHTLKLTRDLLRDAFPTADFFYAVWRDDWLNRPEATSMLSELATVRVIEEYDIHYHPYEDNKDCGIDTTYWHKKFEFPNPDRHLHQTKQILNHNTMMKNYMMDYDVIVRSRFDALLSPFVKYDTLLKECLNYPATISITDGLQSKTSGYSLYDKLVYENDSSRSRMCGDSGTIIHRAADWDCDLVERLHNDKKLLAAEFGWYQSLVQYTTHKNYISYNGASKLTRCHSKDEIRNFEATL